MSSTVIRIEGLSKQYVLRHQKPERYQALRDVITSSAKSAARRLLHPFRHRTRQSNTSRELFWALKDINLEVRQGDRLGVIGRNGAGKSTLLKILSRITEPSSGRVSIKGRISSLLEVGTGFHPELTGRENIFLNGSILGMRMAEIKRKFDEIVAFAEVEKFLDTPVKHYSSGMYVRLAFSVAAHLEPEILVVDEVLAVGDAQFQKKCMGKMQEVGKDGHTVLFVSHNMTTITSLCNTCLLLDRGQAVAVGDPTEITTLYFQRVSSGTGSSREFDAASRKPGDEIATLCSARVIDEHGDTIDYATRGQRIGIEMVYEILQDGHRPFPNIHVFTQGQYAFIGSDTRKHMPLPKGRHKSVMWIPGNFLNDGIYYMGIALSSMDPVRAHFYEQELLYFTVVDDLNDPARNDYTLHIPGVVRPNFRWTSDHIQ